MKYHLKHDLDINKSTIKKTYENNYSYLTKEELKERGLDKASELLDARTQFYTKKQIELLLVSVWWTGHDECVSDLGSDCNLDAYRTEQKREAINYALDYIGSEIYMF